jgi:hypothetical protein
MSRFPPQSWACRLLADLDTYASPAPTDRLPRLTAMMAIRYNLPLANSVVVNLEFFFINNPVALILKQQYFFVIKSN